MTAREKLIDSIQRLTDNEIEFLQRVVDEIATETSIKPVPACVQCGSQSVVRNGHKHKKQAYLCRKCGKSFVETTNTVMYYSHFDKSVWEKVTQDTFDCKAIDKTANEIGTTHKTIFHMRHKLLKALEDTEEETPTKLGDISELDETYVLESYKGSQKSCQESGRMPRKHGAKASKRGISSEYVCICAGVQRKGTAYAHTVNRAKPSNSELKSVFVNHIADHTLALCDGMKGYQCLESVLPCTVANVNLENMDHSTKSTFYNLNTVNNFHSFIKQHYKQFRGVATKYLNRYNTLFSTIYRKSQETANLFLDAICQCSSNHYFHNIQDIQEDHLLLLPL